jgi:hypothetical protein
MLPYATSAHAILYSIHNQTRLECYEAEYILSLQTNVVLTGQHNVMVKSEKLIGTKEYLTLWAMCRSNRCRYKRDRLYLEHTIICVKHDRKSQNCV